MRWSGTSATGVVALSPEQLGSNPGYEAWRITPSGHGQGAISSTGTLNCQPGHLCAAYVVLFRATITVP